MKHENCEYKRLRRARYRCRFIRLKVSVSVAQGFDLYFEQDGTVLSQRSSFKKRSLSNMQRTLFKISSFFQCSHTPQGKRNKRKSLIIRKKEHSAGKTTFVKPKSTMKGCSKKDSKKRHTEPKKPENALFNNHDQKATKSSPSRQENFKKTEYCWKNIPMSPNCRKIFERLRLDYPYKNRSIILCHHTHSMVPT